jgi:hypothetical protein
MKSVLGLSFTGNGKREKIKRGPRGLKVKVRTVQGQGTGCERLTGANSLRAENYRDEKVKDTLLSHLYIE